MDCKCYKLGLLLVLLNFVKNSNAVQVPDGFVDVRQGDYYAAVKELPSLKASGKTADYYLAWMRWFGYGISKDTEASMTSMQNMAATGFRDAERWIANYHLKDHQYADALKWYQILANQGDEAARKYTAAAYYYGVGAKPNAAAAKKYAPKEFFISFQKYLDSNIPEYETKNFNNFKSALGCDVGCKDFYGTTYYFSGNQQEWHKTKETEQHRHVPFPVMAKLSPELLFTPNYKLIQPYELDLTEYLTALMPLVTQSQKRLFSYPIYPINRHIQALRNSQSMVLKHEPWCSVLDDGLHMTLDEDMEEINYFNKFVNPAQTNWVLKTNYKAVVNNLYDRAILGDADAQFQLAQLYDEGIGVARSPEQAVVYYELATIQQDVRAEYNLGLMYLSGLTKDINYAKGIEWLQDAAFKGNAYAQYVMAMLYKEGINDPQGYPIVEQDESQSLAMLYLAAANHFPDAQYQLANALITRDPKKIISRNSREHQQILIKELYENAYLSGIPEAQMPLAFFNIDSKSYEKKQASVEIITEMRQQDDILAKILYALILDRGITVPVDHEAAVAIFEQYPNTVVSKFVRGTYQWQGLAVRQDKALAKELLSTAAEQGFSDANYNLAIMHQNDGKQFAEYLDKALQQGNYNAGMLLADNQFALNEFKNIDQKSLDLYKYFATRGDEEAQTKIGYLYQTGIIGGKPNWDEANKWYQMAADQNYAPALYMIGLMEQTGIKQGFQDLQKAMRNYKKSAKQEYEPALVALGFLSETALGQYNEATNYYEGALKNNKQIQYESYANYNLGLMYELGKGTVVNKELAFQYYLRAARLPIGQKAIPAIMTRLGYLYYQVKKDDSQALLWLNKAAELGDPDANFQLGQFYETGTIVGKDQNKAIEYYRKAANAGHEQATFAVANLSQSDVQTPEGVRS